MVSLLLLFLFVRWDDILFAEKNQTHKYYFHALYFSCVWVWELLLLVAAPWFSSLDSVWEPCTDSEYTAELFRVQIVWYAHCLLESCVQDRGRSDFAMMMAHHAVTIVLIAGAWQTNHHRVGLLVCVEQDFTDIVINISKLLHKSVSSVIVHTLCIVTLAVSWFATRVFLLGAILVWSAGVVTYASWPLLGLLGGLWYMQLAWGMSIVRLASTYFRRGVVHDECEG